MCVRSTQQPDPDPIRLARNCITPRARTTIRPTGPRRAGGRRRSGVIQACPRRRGGLCLVLGLGLGDPEGVKASACRLMAVSQIELGTARPAGPRGSGPGITPPNTSHIAGWRHAAAGRGVAGNGEPYVRALHHLRLSLGPAASSSWRTSPAPCLPPCPQPITLGATCGLPPPSPSAVSIAVHRWALGSPFRFRLGRPLLSTSQSTQLVNSQCTFCLFLIGKSSSQVFTYPAIYTE